MQHRLLFVFLFLFATNLAAQNTFLKQFSASDGKEIEGNKIITVSGGYIVNFLHDGIPGVIKFDNLGRVLWSRTISDKKLAHIISLAASGNNFYIAGTFSDIKSSLFVSQCDSAGNIRWTRSIDDDVDTLNCSVVSTDNGGCLISAVSVTTPSLFVMKFNADGNFEWKRFFGFEGFSLPLAPVSLLRLDSANYLLSAYPFDESQTIIFLAPTMIKFDLGGNVKWAHIDSTLVIALSATPTSDGGFALCGEGLQEDFLHSNFYIAKFNSDGNLEWGKQIDNFEDEFANDIVEMPGGNLLAVGFRQIFDSIGTLSEAKAMIVQMSKTGDPLTIKLLNIANQRTFGNGIVHSTDGGFLFIGSMQKPKGKFSLLLGKLNASGDGCGMSNQLGILSSNDFISDFGNIVNSDVSHSTIDLKMGPGIEITEKEICSEVFAVPQTSDSVDDFIIYPNPSFETVHIVPVGIQSEISAVSVTNMLGTTFELEPKTEGGKTSIDLSRYPPGVYIVECRSEKNIKRKVLIKK
jgi:hypothetical protein